MDLKTLVDLCTTVLTVFRDHLPLLLAVIVVAFFIGIWFQRSVDDGELRGLRAQKQAADDRLALAHERYQPMIAEVAVLREKVSEQARLISDVKSSPAFQQPANAQFNIMANRLERLLSSNTEIGKTITDLSTATTSLGTTLEIIGPKGKVSVPKLS